MRHTLLRTKETYAKYDKAKKSSDFMLTKPAIREYKCWRIIENDFPYDAVAKVHHLLCRNDTYNDYDAHCELVIIKKMIREAENSYDCIIENFLSTQSIPDREHYHLIKWKVI